MTEKNSKETGTPQNDDPWGGWEGPPFKAGDVAYMGHDKPGRRTYRGPYAPVEVLSVNEKDGKRMYRVKTLWRNPNEEMEVEETALYSGEVVWD
ncbi:MAG: hypothetical protein QXD77_01780 [Candidatus Aenigmatarchaeota archaeon]